MNRVLLVAAMSILAATSLSARQQPASQGGPSWTIDSWNVPWTETRPRDPFADRQGRVWFVGQEGDYVAMLDPTTGRFEKYDLEPGAGPHNLIVADNGIVWYSGNRTGYIGRLDPATRDIQRFPLPDPAIRDPHTMVFDRAGNIWFTAQQGNVVGHFNTTSHEIRLVRVPTPRARPYGIRMDRQDRPWFVEFGANKLAMVDPATMELHEYTLPRADARPRRMAITSDGAVWYGDYVGGYLGRFDPATRRFEEFRLPNGPVSLPYALMNDDQDRIWVVETGVQPNNFVGFDYRTKTFLPGKGVPGGGGTTRHMSFDAQRGVMWFGTDNGTIGRANLPAARATP